MSNTPVMHYVMRLTAGGFDTDGDVYESAAAARDACNPGDYVRPFYWEGSGPDTRIVYLDAIEPFNPVPDRYELRARMAAETAESLGLT